MSIPDTGDYQRPSLDGSPREALLPMGLGLAAGVVTYLALFVIILSITLAGFDYSKTFGNADAVEIALQSGLGLGVASGLGAWICARRSRARDIPATWVQRSALITGLTIGLAAILLGLAPGLRGITLPIYLLLPIIGTLLGIRLSSPRGT